MEAETPGDTRGDGQALVDKVTDSLPEVDVETLGDTLSDAQALVESVADTVVELVP